MATRFEIHITEHDEDTDSFPGATIVFKGPLAEGLAKEFFERKTAGDTFLIGLTRIDQSEVATPLLGSHRGSINIPTS